MNIPVSIIIPTYNAGKEFEKLALMIKKQTVNINQVLVIDSTSTDETVKIANKYGFTVEIIPKSEFGHGKTRQYAIKKTNTEIVVFLTQDALLYDEFSIENLVQCLISEEKIAAVYGRQIPYADTGILGKFARLFNYPETSKINTFEDRKEKGIKTTFFSDSFSAYKKTYLMKIGGFPLEVNFSEDTYVAGKLLKAGYKTAYCAEAKVFHSHNLSLIQEYKRYKEIGKFYRQEKWLLETFGKAEGEGLKFVISEAKYLVENGKFYYLPIAFLHNVVKYLGYRGII